MENQIQIQNIVASFAKANKVSKAKAEAFANEILATSNKAKKAPGRPMLDKTKELHREIILAVKSGYQGRDAALVRKLVGCDSVAFNNAVNYLVKQGKIRRAGKVKTGKRGRQPYKLVLC